MNTAATVDGRAAAQAMLDAGKSQDVDFVGETVTPFGATDFASALTEAKAKNPTAIILNLYGWDLVHALKVYTKLELEKEKIGVGGMIAGEQIGWPLAYANNAGV
jgi:branched-chain amino acid transport system substrate-binding protein